MKISVYILLLFLSLGNACSKENENLPVIATKSSKIDSINLSTIFEKGDLVKLGNTDPLIGRIDKIIKNRSFVFVKDVSNNSRLLQFDMNGNFIREVGNIGHGPAEHTGIHDFTVDSENNVFIATYQKLLSYNSNNVLQNSCRLGSDNVKMFSCLYITLINDELWTFQNKAIVPGKMFPSDTYICNLIRYDKQLRPIDTTTMLKASYNIELYLIDWSTYISDLENHLYAYFPAGIPEPFLRDTLYELKNLKKIPRMKFDFSDVLSVNPNADINYEDFPKRLEAKSDVRNIQIRDMIRTQRYIFIRYSNIWENLLFCYDLKDNKGYNMPGGFNDDIAGTSLKVNLIPIDLKTGEFCFVRDGFELEGIIDNVDEKSNPVIFFVNTKE